jgi:hypothetical protein
MDAVEASTLSPTTTSRRSRGVAACAAVAASALASARLMAIPNLTFRMPGEQSKSRTVTALSG